MHFLLGQRTREFRGDPGPVTSTSDTVVSSCALGSRRTAKQTLGFLVFLETFESHEYETVKVETHTDHPTGLNYVVLLLQFSSDSEAKRGRRLAVADGKLTFRVAGFGGYFSSGCNEPLTVTDTG